MSSEAVGVQARIKALLKKAVYTHCCGHNLNLVIVSAFKFLLSECFRQSSRSCANVYQRLKKDEIVRGSRETEPPLLFTKSNFKCMCYLMG